MDLVRAAASLRPLVVEHCAQFASKGVGDMTRKAASKLFYLGGTALLSSIILMTGARADNVSSVTSLSPNIAHFNPGTVLQSPSGVYYADLMSNGSFVVSQGTDPTTSGIHSVFSTAMAGPTRAELFSQQALVSDSSRSTTTTVRS
jgi:hypothetical protein